MKRFLVKTIDIALYCASILVIGSALSRFYCSDIFLQQILVFTSIHPLLIAWLFRLVLLNAKHSLLTFQWFTFFLLLLVQLHATLPQNSLFPNSPSEGRQLLIYSQNVHQFQNEYDRVQLVIEQIKESKADIVLLQEFGLYDKWPDAQGFMIEFARECGFEYHHYTPHKDNIYGIAMLSKNPIIDAEVLFQYRSYTNEGIRYVVEFQDTVIEIVGVHFQSFNLQSSSSNTLSMYEVMAMHFEQVNSIFDLKFKPQLVIGDFNEVESGPAINRLNSEGYSDMQKQSARGFEATFPTLNVRLDYCFARADLWGKIYCKTLQSAGSDHKALLISINE